jgi:hypothetical protein
VANPLVAGPAGTPGATFGQPVTPINQLAAKIANAASADGKPLVSPQMQAMLNFNTRQAGAATPQQLARVYSGLPPGPVAGNNFGAPAAGTGSGVGGAGRGGGAGGGSTGNAPKASDAIPPGSNPGDAKVAAPVAPGVAPAPLPNGVAGILGKFGFKLPAQTWDALIAFGAGLMKNSDKPHFAQAAGAALEAATAQMTDQDKTKFAQDLENRKLVAQNEQRRAELDARIDNQKLTHAEHDAALAQRAQLAQEHNELLTTLYQGRSDSQQATRDLHATIAQGQQSLEQQRLQQQQQQATATEAARQQQLQESANTGAQTRAKDLEAQIQSDPQLSQLPPNLKQAWISSQLQTSHPASSMAQAWPSYKPQVVSWAKSEIARGSSPALVLQKYSHVGFPITAADLQ